MKEIASLLKFCIIWAVFLVVTGLFLAIIFPADETGQTTLPPISILLLLGVPSIVATKTAPIHYLLGTNYRKVAPIFKRILVWICLTIVFLQLDASFDLSKKNDIYPVFFVLIPILCAFFSPIKHLFKSALNHWRDRTSSNDTRPPHTPPSPPHPIPPSPRIRTSMSRIDAMEGHEFERFTADLLRRLGYQNVEVTRGSGDQGVDVLAEKEGVRYAIQCKCYSSDLGNKPVQEVNTGKVIYHCHVGVVITNRHFTAGAREAAAATGVLLWDREKLQAMLETAR